MKVCCQPQVIPHKPSFQGVCFILSHQCFSTAVHSHSHKQISHNWSHKSNEGMLGRSPSEMVTACKAMASDMVPFADSNGRLSIRVLACTMFMSPLVVLFHPSAHQESPHNGAWSCPRFLPVKRSDSLLLWLVQGSGSGLL